MKKTIILNITALIISAAAMFFPVFIVSKTALAHGSLLTMLIFFALDPLISAAAGVFAGFDIQQRRYVIFYPALSFLALIYVVFPKFEPMFLFYTAAYILIAVIAMAITVMLKIKKLKNSLKDSKLNREGKNAR